MSDTQGGFIWHALATGDVAGAIDFYKTVVGWTVAATSDGEANAIFKAGEDPVAALIDASVPAKGVDTPTGWIGYLQVADVDEAADRIVRLGGAIHEAPSDAPDLGRLAIASDPQGALVGLFAPRPSNAGEGPGSTAGRFGWRELYTSDPDAAIDFYTQAFGWRKDHAFDMGPAGRYQLFSIGGRQAGGVMRAPPGLARCVWNPFVRIGDIAAVEARVLSEGGVVFDGLREAPGGDWTVKCIDPQGAMFALTGRRT